MSVSATGQPIRIGLVGLGKIAQDQHIPAVAANSDFQLVAGASPHSRAGDLKVYPTLEEMLAGEPHLDAVALCTPPQVRPAMARTVIAAGKAVLLEKPPCASVAAAQHLVALAKAADVTLYATWHSRHAAAVEPARAWLSGRKVREVEVTWKEDVRRWHPGQDWIFEAGGFGVFDPGINALSIVTRILPNAMALDRADLSFPANRASPIAANLRFLTDEGAEVRAVFDFLQTGPQTWNIRIVSDHGEELLLTDGGAHMQGDGVEGELPMSGEYPAIYRRFAELVRSGESDADLSPLIHVADAFLLGRRIEVEDFHDDPSTA